MKPATPVETLPQIGKSYASKLKRLNITTVEDLINHFPFRYDDFSQIAQIASIDTAEKLSVQGVLWQIKNLRTKNGKFITVATVADQSGTVEVIWFNQPYLIKSLKPGIQISLSGKPTLEGSKVKLISPAYEMIRPNSTRQNGINNQALHTSRLVPIYPETEGLSSKWLRTKIAKILPHYLENLKDYMPQNIIKRQKFLSLQESLSKVHLPKDYSEVEAAIKRLAFDEVFLTQLLSKQRKIRWQKHFQAPPITMNRIDYKNFSNSLPFTLTKAQVKAIKEITKDMRKTVPTNRLLEGDVGSGKTVVAAFAAFIAVKNGLKVLLAAPTEILTFQHQKTLESLLKPLGVTVGIWTGSKKQDSQITCGTHALLSSYKTKEQIGLVIVDEQHRFGVAQRAKLFLEQSSILTPHLLTMTATPIPRTLALTLYGDLNLSILDEMPKGRRKISTYVVPNNKRLNAYSFIEKEVLGNKQAFIITPFIEPSESMTSVKAAVEEFKNLKEKFSKNVNLGLLHGKLKSKEKESVINKFKKNKIDILVSTPVVEVGIDVPNATIMLIETADRFGLAQLHQLRGRVGRGTHKSYCFLFTDSKAKNSMKRLKSMEKIHVGFELAEIDLKIRGSGEIFGLKQSGFENFKIADISDYKLIKQAQFEAGKIIDSDYMLHKHPLLKEKVNKLEEAYSQPN